MNMRDDDPVPLRTAAVDFGVSKGLLKDCGLRGELAIYKLGNKYYTTPNAVRKWVEILPRRSKGPRLYLDPRRKQYIIRDGSRFVRTGCGERDSAKAEKFLAQYIGHKHTPEPSGAPMIAEVLDAYRR